MNSLEKLKERQRLMKSRVRGLQRQRKVGTGDEKKKEWRKVVR